MTIDGLEPIERRLDTALVELRALRRDVDALAQRVASLEDGRVAARATPAADAVPGPIEVADDSVWSLVGQSRVLPRVAIVCFVLVVALILRTLTDSGVVGRPLGVVLGIGYAAALVAIGVRLLAAGGRGRRVLPVCGALLTCTVVLEAHGPFGVLSSASANWILLATAVVVAAIGLRFRSASILAFSSLATAVTALAIGFPHPSYPHAAAVVLAANVVAALAHRVGRMQWLSWVVLLVTIALWTMWSFQVNAFLREPAGAVSPIGLEPSWFVPFVVVFATVHVVIAALRAWTAGEAFDAFHATLPTASLCWAWPSALAFALPATGTAAGVAAVAGGAALGEFALASWFARRGTVSRLAVSSFAIAATFALVLATPTLLGRVDLALPIWSVLGVLLFVASRGRTGLRITSVLLQVLVAGVAVVADVFASPSEIVVTAVFVGLAVAALAAAHYRLARARPPADGTLLARVDRGNRLGIVLLWVAAFAVFAVLRIVVREVAAVVADDVPNAATGATTVVVNVASIALMLVGLRTRSGELLATAVLVACYGGLRVVGSDLLGGGHGVPLVMSVASFGAAAAVGSIVLGRWLAQRPGRTGEAPAT